MTEFLQLTVFFFAAINPAAVAGAPKPADRPLPSTVITGGAIIGVAILAVAALLAGRILDGLGVEPETFRVGAGVVLLISGALLVWEGASPHRGRWEGRGAMLFPLALPIVATPAAVACAVSYGADVGAAKTIGAAAIVAALAALALIARLGRYHAATDGVARLTGAALIAVAAGLIVDGVRAI